MSTQCASVSIGVVPFIYADIKQLNSGNLHMGVTGFDNECRDGRSEPRNHCDLENLRWKTIGAKQKSTNFALAA